MSVLTACGGGDQDITNHNAMIARNSVNLSATSPSEGDQFADLERFGSAVADSRIVVLNESIHGDANAMNMNSRLIQYLHKKKGFEVLLLESGIYDVARMRELKEEKNVPYADSAAGRIFYYFSRTKEGRQMIQYAEAMATVKPTLELAGIDVLQAGVESTGTLISRLEQYLASKSSGVLQSADWAAFRNTVAVLAQADPKIKPKTDELVAFNRVIPKLESELCGTQYSGGKWLESGSFWCQITQSIRQEAPYLWNTSGEFDQPPRDIAQAANARWLLEGPFKGKKAILVTHSLHGMISAGYVNTGSELAKYYPGQIHTSQITNSLAMFSPALNAYDLELYLSLSREAKYISYPSNESDRDMLSKLAIREKSYIPSRPNYFGKSYNSLFYLTDSTEAKPEWEKYPSKYW
jgi:erythromycin esterase